MHVGLRWTTANGRSEGSATLEQLQLECHPSQNGRLDQSRRGRLDLDKNGRLDSNKNGSLDPSQNGRLEPSQNARCEPTKNGSLDAKTKTNGSLDRSQKGGLEGGVAVANGDPSAPERTVGTGYGSLGASPVLSDDVTLQKTSML